MYHMKTLITSAVVVCSMAAWASSEAAPNTVTDQTNEMDAVVSVAPSYNFLSRTHVYVSGQLGIIQNALRPSGRLSAPKVHYPVSSQPDATSSGVLGEVGVGVLENLSHHIIVGVEGHTSVNHASSSVTTEDSGEVSSVTSKIQYNYGLSMLAGTSVLFPSHHTFTYARVGWVRGLVETESVGKFGNMSGYDGNLKHWDNGIRFGIGMMSQITDHWSWRSEFDYTDYTHFSAHSIPHFFQHTSETAVWNYKPYQVAFMVGLVYNFM